MTRARSLALRTAPVLTLSLLVAAPAYAHGSAQIGDFYQGLFQPVFHPEFLLGAVAIALWSTQQQQRADPGDPGQAPQSDPLGTSWGLLETRELVE